MKKSNRTDLIISIVFAELVGAVSALLSGSFSGVCSELTKPPFSPPAWLFPVVWAILYALMGVSAYIVSKSRHYALKIYFLQLFVNFSWSILFFRFMLLKLSAVTAVVLALLVALMIYSFLRINRTAGLLNIPYLVWTVFASYLAIGTAVLN